MHCFICFKLLNYFRSHNIVGFNIQTLGTLLAAETILCDQRFDVKIKDVRFVGYPLHLHNPNSKMVQTIQSFNVVIVLRVSLYFIFFYPQVRTLVYFSTQSLLQFTHFFYCCWSSWILMVKNSTAADMMSSYEPFSPPSYAHLHSILTIWYWTILYTSE